MNGLSTGFKNGIEGSKPCLISEPGKYDHSKKGITPKPENSLYYVHFTPTINRNLIH